MNIIDDFLSIGRSMVSEFPNMVEQLLAHAHGLLEVPVRSYNVAPIVLEFQVPALLLLILLIILKFLELAT